MHGYKIFKTASNQVFRSSKNFVRLCAGREHVLAASRRSVSASYPPSFASALARMSSTAIAGGVGNGLSSNGGSTLDGGGLARLAMVGELLEGSDDDDTTRFKRVKVNNNNSGIKNTNQQEPLASSQSGIRSGAADAAGTSLLSQKLFKAKDEMSQTASSLNEDSNHNDDDDINVQSRLHGSLSSSSSIDLNNESSIHEERYSSLLNDKPYEGPLMDALLTRDGKVLPLDKDDIEMFDHKFAEGSKVENGKSNKGEPTPAKIAAAQANAIEGVFAKRALRAVYSQKELDEFVTAVEIQYGRGTFDTDGLTEKFGGTGLSEAKKNLSTRRRDDFRLGEDPLLDRGPLALPFNIRGITMISNLTWNARPNSNAVDKKASVTVLVSSLGLNEPVNQYLRSIAGPRYNSSNDVLRISSEKHVDSSSNKRECIERLVKLVKEATTLSDKYGPMKISKRMPLY
jgi:hypothetical protein